MSDAITTRGKLDALAVELDTQSKELARIGELLEPVAEAYTEFINDYEADAWLKHVDEGAKLPPAAIRLALAHREMDPELLHGYRAAVNNRDRTRKRISDLKVQVDAERSMLSAFKAEMEASR